jgi:hypothetical protein
MNPDKNNPIEEWEEILDRELDQLPERQAPETLMPRVIAAIEARAKQPWWQRSWWTWPPAARLLSVLLITGILVACINVSLMGWESSLFGALTAKAGSVLSAAGVLLRCLEVVGGSLALVLRSVNGWALAGLGLVGVIMYLSCVGLGTLIYRVAYVR